MNGRMDIAPINPCPAEADRYTYGWRRMHVSQWGQRWMRVDGMGCRVVDLYPNGGYRVFYTHSRNGGMVFVPGGSTSGPMPDLHRSGRGCACDAERG